MKAEQLGLTLEEVKKSENEQLMNILMLMGSVNNNMMSHENEIVEVNEDEIDEYKDGKHMKHKAKASTKTSSKAKSSKIPEYVMDFYLSNLE
jgi:hypothetical protein